MIPFILYLIGAAIAYKRGSIPIKTLRLIVALMWPLILIGKIIDWIHDKLK